MSFGEMNQRVWIHGESSLSFFSSSQILKGLNINVIGGRGDLGAGVL